MPRRLRNESEETETVTVPVTINLASALAHLRYSKQPLMLWIDAICINQEDHAERSKQICKMDRIYSDAQHTIVWLGPVADGSDKVMKLLVAIGREFGVFHFGGPGRSLQTILANPEIWSQGPEGAPVDDRGQSMEYVCWKLAGMRRGKGYTIFRDIDALAKFLDRPWWTRAG